MAPAESEQDWEEGGGENEVDLEYLMEEERRGRRAEEYVEVEGDSDAWSSSSDLLSVYFSQIGREPLQKPNQELRTAVALAAARAFQCWKENPKTQKSHTMWEEAYIHLFRSWGAVQTYCTVYTVPLPVLHTLLQSSSRMIEDWKDASDPYVRCYLQPLGWGKGGEEGACDAQGKEHAAQLEKLSSPLFTMVYAMVVLPPSFRAFILQHLACHKNLPQAQEVDVFLRTLSAAELEGHERWIVDRGHEAKTKLILSNTRFAVERAKKYRERGVDFEDLIQDANLGLIKAADTFEPHRGNRFSTHAGWKMQGSLSDGVEHEGRTVRLKGNTTQEIAQLEEAERVFTEVRGREPTLEELSTILGKSAQVIQRIQQASRQGITSLDATVEAEEGESASLLEKLEAKVPDPSERAYQLALKEIFDEVLKTLDPRERTIVVLRHGLENGPPYTLEQVAAIMDITRERIRQIESRGEARIIRMIADRFPHLLPEGMSQELAHVVADRRDYSKRNKRRVDE